MSRRTIESARSTLGWSFALFTFASAFSIALAQVSLGVALVSFLIIVIADRHIPWRRPLLWFYRLMAAYVLWLAVSAVFGATPLTSLAALREEWLFVIVPISVYLFGNPRWRFILVRCLAGGVIVSAIYALTQLATGTDWLLHHDLHTFGGKGVRLSGLFSYPLTFGNYMVTAATFLLGYAIHAFKSLSRRDRWWLLAAAVLGIAVVALSNSRGPMLALAVSLLAVGWLIGKMKYILIAGAVIVVAALFVVTPRVINEYVSRLQRDVNLSDEASRIVIFNNSLKMVRDHPVTGVGLNNFEDEYAIHLRDADNEDIRQKHAHNDLLNVAATAGIPAMLLFISLWVVVIRFVWKGLRGPSPPDRTCRFLAAGALVASVAFLVASMTEATFADEEVRQCIMLVWGAGLSRWQIEPQPEETA